jgi:hypothetical protein
MESLARPEEKGATSLSSPRLKTVALVQRLVTRINARTFDLDAAIGRHGAYGGTAIA